MTRFIMSISSAASMILKVTSISNSGEIYILKMPSIKIEDLAQYCKENKIRAIGLSDSANLCGA